MKDMPNVLVMGPSCGAVANIEGDEDTRKCSYCGITYQPKKAVRIRNAVFTADTQPLIKTAKETEDEPQVTQEEKSGKAIHSAEVFQNAIVLNPALLDGRFLLYGDACGADAPKGKPFAMLVLFEEHLHLVPLNQPNGKQPFRFLRMEDFVRMWPWYYPSHDYSVHLEFRGPNHLHYQIRDEADPNQTSAVREYDLLLSDRDYVPENPYLVVAGLGSKQNFTYEWKLSGKYDKAQMREILRYSQNRCRKCGQKVKLKGLLLDKVICPNCGDVSL